MYSITDFMFWLSLIYIFVSFFVAFYIPGRVVIGNYIFRQKKAVHVVSIIIGIVLWAWQGYFFGITNLRWFSFIYLILFFGIYIFKKYYREIRFPIKALKTFDPIILAIVIPGVIAQTFSYFHMGIQTAKGVLLTGHHVEDHIWHAGIISELIDRFPPHEPGMSGIILKDYHYWFNLVTADLIRVFHLPALQTQFIGMYLIASILLAFIGYYLAKLIYDRKMFIRVFLFLLYFAGDVTGWIMLIFQHKFDFTLASIINNATNFVDSPPFAYSILIGLTALYLLFQGKVKLSKKMIIICALLFSSLLEFKVYTGITFMAGLTAYAGYSFIMKQYDKVLVFIIACIFGVFVFFPGISSTSGLIYAPMLVPRDFITQKTLGFHDWELKWRIYYDHSNYPRLIQYGIYMSMLYLVVQFGIQISGLIPSRRVLHILSFDKAIILYSIVLTGIILALFFYQKVGGANIWEFLLPVGYILSLLSALIITTLLENKSKIIKIIIIIIIIVFVIPRWILTVREDFTREFLSVFHGIEKPEYLSYSFMENNISKDDIVMIVNSPYPDEIVSVAKIFTGARLYFSGEGVRQQTTPEILRRRSIHKLVQAGNIMDKYDLLKNEKIRYLYYYGNSMKNYTDDERYKVVFQNSVATILRIKP